MLSVQMRRGNRSGKAVVKARWARNQVVYGLILGMLLGWGLAGCGGQRLETVPVSGRVTYGGGQWPKEGRLDFRPIAAPPGKTLHPASAQFGPDGRFTVVSQQTPGLAPGEYAVTVECWQEMPSMGDLQNPRGSPGKSYVPEKYRDPKTTPIKLKIEPTDRSKTLEFDVPKP
ncbi:MAG: hypothetical protein NZ602_02210 [Thermoguttaceae bacterium]|nr:hypothetical protein [Thermoguttaceae bacterium]MDW8039445.1 hypothetical protein [Thermoguttaceae bacterium]